MKPWIAISALLLLSLLLFHNSEASIDCNTVMKDVAPCISYLKSGNGVPSAACCSGVSTLASAASTTADRRAACSCLKSAVSKIKPNIAAAKGLPGSCGISLSYAVSPNLDCSTIS